MQQLAGLMLLLAEDGHLPAVTQIGNPPVAGIPARGRGPLQWILTRHSLIDGICRRFEIVSHMNVGILEVLGLLKF